MTPGLSDEAINTLLETIYQQYGYDFTGYSRASLNRRILRLMQLDKMPSLDVMRLKLQTDANYARHFMEEITVNVTEMFRDPAFYQTLRNTIFPLLNTFPRIRIWHAGCSTGEEVISMSILLKEENLSHKSLIYATDINPAVIEKAKKAIFPLSQMQLYSANYIAAGGKNDFSSYYTANYGYAAFNASLTEKIIFATHNLVTDKSFNEFQLIVCRNVLIYFDKELQDRVFQIFDESLEKSGFLALGAKETLRFSPLSTHYRQMDREKIWKKIQP